jgi:long-chain acyl-CoA synthetase
MMLSLSLAIGLSAGAAVAKECKGVNFPEQIQLDGVNLVLNGTGLRQATVFKVDVYVAALYVPKASNDAATLLNTDAAKQMTLQFVRNVGANDLRNA